MEEEMKDEVLNHGENQQETSAPEPPKATSEPQPQPTPAPRARRQRQPKPQKPVKTPKPEGRGRKFWRVVFGSMIGFILAQIVMTFCGIFLLIAMIGGASTSIPKNSVLELTLAETIAERSTEQINFSILGPEKTEGLDDILLAIRRAADDKKIKGISLNLTQVAASPATLQEIRRVLEEFKKSGKFVYAYSDSYSQGAYYLASVADKVYLNPQGNIDFRGMCIQSMYYKGLLDKLEVDVEVVKHGRYKSAVEPYSRENMSEANREQSEALITSIWGTFCNDISTSRKIAVEKLNEIADSMLISTANDALALHLVDEVDYRTGYNKALRKKMALNEDDKATLVSLNDYKNTWPSMEFNNKSGDKIAVVYAVGEIVDGQGSETVIGSVTLGNEIRRAYQDDDVKAIVLRVNSPGGSALASEVIWNEIEQAKAAGKIVVTSMGDYAASGGYYISCNSDAIVAQPTTITGSIGVFGMVPSFGNFLSHKLGVNVDHVSTNAHSDALSGYRTMDARESEYMQNSVDATYKTFITRVAKGRGMQIDDVDSIGMGRVWTGADGLKIGIVDKLGNLHDAIDLAAEKAGITDFKVVYYPKKRSFFEIVNENEYNEREIEAAMKNELGEFYPAYAALRQIRHTQGVQARLPMEFIIR